MLQRRGSREQDSKRETSIPVVQKPEQESGSLGPARRLDAMLVVSQGGKSGKKNNSRMRKEGEGRGQTIAVM